ncbi:hypothetical protein NFI96_007425, partial [Prochilodus magdalenae]
MSAVRAVGSVSVFVSLRRDLGQNGNRIHSWEEGGELASVNVASGRENMPVFVGYDGQTVSSLSELSGGEVGTRSSRDLEETKRKTDASEETSDFQRAENERSDRKESEEKEIIRRTSVVDILRRNVGAPKPIFATDNSAELEFEKVDSASPELEHRSWAGEESDSKSSDLSTSLKVEESEVSDSEGDAESDYRGGRGGAGGDEGWQSEEHVYCTVYCIASDDRRRPSGPRGDSDDEAHYALPLTDSPSPDLAEPYTLSDLVDPAVLRGGHSAAVSVVLPCRICLDDRHIRPLHCCQKAVCEECLRTYVSSQ